MQLADRTSILKQRELFFYLHSRHRLLLNHSPSEWFSIYKKEPPKGLPKEGDTRYFLRERMDMPRAATAMRAAAAATISLAPVEGFF